MPSLGREHLSVRSDAQAHIRTLFRTVLVHAFSLAGQTRFRMLSSYGPYNGSRYIHHTRFTLAVRYIESCVSPLCPRASHLPIARDACPGMVGGGRIPRLLRLFLCFSQSSLLLCTSHTRIRHIRRSNVSLDIIYRFHSNHQQLNPSSP